MKLEELRTRIDEIDKDLLRLLELRFQVVKEIGLFKKEHNLPVLDKAREVDVLKMRQAQLTNKDNWPHFEAIFQLIMKVSKDLEA